MWPVAALLMAIGGPAAAQPSFIEFESGPTRPLALSADGATLYAVNTPDNTLEIFDVVPAGLSHRASVPVGMEPVAVALRGTGDGSLDWLELHEQGHRRARFDGSLGVWLQP